MRFISLILMTFTVQIAMGAGDNDTNLLAVGQGISLPSSTTTINYSTGYTSESPIGTIYQNGTRVTGEYDKNGSAAFGFEVGHGAGEWGIAAGHRKRDCENCKGRTAAALGVIVADMGLGLRIEEGAYGAGLLLNPQGEHRIGFLAEINDGNGEDSRVTAYGIGYSYVASQITFTLDASTRNYENSLFNDDRIVLTPGLMVKADILQLSVNDNITFNNNNPNGSDENHNLWVGIGIGGDDWHLAIYIDYVNETALAASFFF